MPTTMHRKPSSQAISTASALDALEPGSKLGVIRVVVVVPGHADEAEPSPMAVETTAGLARLGDPVELLRAQTGAELRQWSEDPSIDLVLLDRLDIADCVDMLGEIDSAGPPSVVIVSGDSEDEALDAFRAGASDCVHFGPDFERVLPVVLLEQVRRWRGNRQRLVSEQRIRRLEDLYAAIVTEMPAGLVVLDPDGLIVAENSEFERLFPSQSSSELSITEFLAARLPGELAEAIERPREDTLPTASADVTAELVRVEGVDGKSSVYELRRRNLGDGDRRLLLISDVTEAEWMSERLEALRRDTRDIIENINSALLVVDPGGRITFANLAAERILGGLGEEAGEDVSGEIGRETGDLNGRQIADWFAADEENANPIEACLLNGSRSRGAETILQRADGKWIPIGLSCSPRLDAEGVSRGAVAIFQDLSEIKELEIQVRQTEKMASIGQLAAGVAHEVNNPMGFIHANLHQMSEYLADLNKYFEATARLEQAALEGDLEVIRAAADDVRVLGREIDLDYVRSDFEKALLESREGAERIRHIVKDLRDFSRPDLPARTPTDVNQALDSTANIVYTMMRHAVVLEKDYGELLKIDAYPMQLKQVFMNLLVNAYQAIELRGLDEPGVIRLETKQIGEEIVVRVVDSGVGIEEADLAHIFEPFFTTKPVGAGTGLGLSTSFNIVERHGGRFLVESEIGRGTTFEVWLPLLAPEPVVDASTNES
jgi:PAS domain S-box-containing protein